MMPSGICKENKSNSGNQKTAKELKNTMGMVVGTGRNINKMMFGKEKNAGVIPVDIDDQLRGQTYHTYDEFKKDFWKVV